MNKTNRKFGITVTPGYYVVMKCSFPHHAPDFSARFFFMEGKQTIKELAKEHGWHFSRKYGWVCNQKHNWHRINASV